MSADFPHRTPTTGPTSDGSSTTHAKDQAMQTAGTAADEGKHVAGVARDEAQRVASEAKSQVNHLLSEATSQVEDQSRTQRDRIVDTLRSFSDDLGKMAAQSDGGIAADLAREGAVRARTLSSQLEGREPRDLLEDVRGFARRKPGTFLLGALAAGVVAGRLTRGAKNGTSAATSRPAVDTYAQHRDPVAYGAPVSDPVHAAGTDVPTDRPATGLPNPAGPVAGDADWSGTRTHGGLS